MNIMMTALWGCPPPAAASARNSCGRARPPNPKPPIRRKSRRESPSQNLRLRSGSPRMVNKQRPDFFVLALSSLMLVVGPSVSLSFGQDGKPPGTWAFTHAPDPFDNKAMLDLRHLNEGVAGESGFLKLTPDGRGFALGN